MASVIATNSPVRMKPPNDHISRSDNPELHKSA
jgi:hypothetical protein